MQELNERLDTITKLCEEAKSKIDRILEDRPEFMKRDRFFPSLAFYHANSRGTGSAVKFSVIPAEGQKDGHLKLTIANQLTAGDRTAKVPTYPTFDWDDAKTVFLDFLDISKILQVLRGETEQIEDGKGLYHISTEGSAFINLRHIVDPFAGYVLEVRSTKCDHETKEYHIVFGCAEACGLTEAIGGVMHRIAFGD